MPPSKPFSVTLAKAIPLPPKCLASSTSSSCCFLLKSAALGMAIALTTPPFFRAEEKTLKPLFFTMLEMSNNFISKRISGLSQPYFSIASA